MLLCDREPTTTLQGVNVVLWSGAATRAGVRSINDFIEVHSDEIRRRYLAWAHDLGEVCVHGRQLDRRFRFSEGTSLWSWSVFAEHSSWKQRSLETLLKVFALEMLLEQDKPIQLSYEGANRDLSLVLGAISRRRGMRYRWIRVTRRRRAMMRPLSRLVPRPMLGLAAIVQFARLARALARRHRSPRVRTAERRCLICGPFSNHNADALGTGRFISRFWEPLPRLLRQGGYAVHWLHYFHPHDKVPSRGEARRYLELIEARTDGSETHSFVESYLPISAMGLVLFRWLKIAVESVIVGIGLQARFREAPQESYWPLIRDDWARAFRGAHCVESLFYAECFDWALRSLDRQDECIYLLENQSWERGLVRAWRKHGHGRLAGVAHSTVRYWDLRYHSDPRRYGERAYAAAVQSPDAVILNGRVAVHEYLATCKTREPIIECEALRYLHLAPDPRRIAGSMQRDGVHLLLVLGDYTASRTNAMLDLLDRARAKVRSSIDYQIKPHPSCPIGVERYSASSYTIVNASVGELVPHADLIFAGNTTSAALEAYLLGAHVLVALDEDGVNFSPLRQMQGVSFIRSAEELWVAIETLRPGDAQAVPRAADFFHTDSDLPRWRDYFNIPSGACGA